jgi:hypothetical protein
MRNKQTKVYRVTNSERELALEAVRLAIRMQSKGDAKACRVSLLVVLRVLGTPADQVKNTDEVYPLPEDLLSAWEKTTLDGLRKTSLVFTDLSRTTVANLNRAGFQTVGDVIRRTERELMRTKYFGRRTLAATKSWLHEAGLELQQGVR